MAGFDVSCFELINSHHSAVFDWFFLVVTQLGNGWVVGPLLLIPTIIVFRRASRARILILGTMALTLAGVVNSGLKKVVDRERPLSYFSVTRMPAYAVHVTGGPLYDRSFPSGHANTAFAAATFAVLIFGVRNAWAFALALLVAYSRVYLGAHFPLDTAAGALIGAAITLALFGAATIFERRHSRPTQSRHAGMADKKPATGS